jgi:spore coat polysaccharide biosynthesis protein SpsF
VKNIACVIARTNSIRLQKKVLKEINGYTLIEYIMTKIKKSKFIDDIYLCTSIDKEDSILLEIAKKNNIKGYAGSRGSVIDRMLDVARIERADNVIRITGDNIFTDEVYLDLMLKYHIQNDVDYTRTEYLPIGITSEIIRVSALKRCRKMMNPNDSQYLLIYMFQPSYFNCQVLIPKKDHQHPDWTLTVDTPEDWERTKLIIDQNTETLNYLEILQICLERNIPYLIAKSELDIKFPANILLTYKAFRAEIDIRIQKSKKVFLKTNEYLEMLKS